MSDDAYELRLFLTELVCNLCRFALGSGASLGPDSVHIRQEVPVGNGDYFADIVVEGPGIPGYIVEVESGQPVERTLAGLERKYSSNMDWFATIQKLVLVVDDRAESKLSVLAEGARKRLPDHWALEIWDQPRLFALIQQHFGVELRSLEPNDLQEVRHVIDHANGRHAFGQDYEDSPFDAALLWHFGYWRLPELLNAAGSKRELLRPGPYVDVAVVFADLCGFSGYVRDTRDERTVRDCLGFFSSKSRQQIIEEGNAAPIPRRCRHRLLRHSEALGWVPRTVVRVRQILASPGKEGLERLAATTRPDPACAGLPHRYRAG